MNQPINRSPELSELLDVAINSTLSEVHTCLPGKVVKYDHKNQCADIKPLIKRRIVHSDGSESLEALPVIPDVPIIFQRGGGFFFSFPLRSGDFVLLHIVDKSIDNFYAGSGEDTDPDEFRMHDLSDAVATPGFYPKSKPIKDCDSTKLVMGFDNGGIQVKMTADGTMEIQVSGDSNEAVLLGNAMRLFWDTRFKPIFDAHFHTHPSGPTGPPAPKFSCPSFDASIISKVLKING